MAAVCFGSLFLGLADCFRVHNGFSWYLADSLYAADRCRFYDAICEYKGMRVSAQSTEPVFSNPSAQTQNNTYDQTQQYGSQNESGEPAVENPAESTDDTNAEISGNFEVDSLF